MRLSDDLYDFSHFLPFSLETALLDSWLMAGRESWVPFPVLSKCHGAVPGAGEVTTVDVDAVSTL